MGLVEFVGRVRLVGRSLVGGLALIALWGSLTILAGLVGVGLTLLTISGVWVTLLAALIMQLTVTAPGTVDGRLFSWWTLAACAGIGVAGEVFELLASAAGAKKTGGGRSGATGSVIGALAGAIAGSILIPIPVAGTVIGAIVGAGGGAFVGERAISGKSLGQATKVAGGAAAGRAVAMIVKIALAGLVAFILSVAVFNP